MADRVLIGCNYPGPDGAERRSEPGDVVPDMPERVRVVLLAQRAIEPLPDEPAPKRQKGGA